MVNIAFHLINTRLCAIMLAPYDDAKECSYRHNPTQWKYEIFRTHWLDRCERLFVQQFSIYFEWNRLFFNSISFAEKWEDSEKKKPNCLIHSQTESFTPIFTEQIEYYLFTHDEIVNSFVRSVGFRFAGKYYAHYGRPERRQPFEYKHYMYLHCIVAIAVGWECSKSRTRKTFIFHRKVSIQPLFELH